MTNVFESVHCVIQSHPSNQIRQNFLKTDLLRRMEEHKLTPHFPVRLINMECEVDRDVSSGMRAQFVNHVKIMQDYGDSTDEKSGKYLLMLEDDARVDYAKLNEHMAAIKASADEGNVVFLSMPLANPDKEGPPLRSLFAGDDDSMYRGVTSTCAYLMKREVAKKLGAALDPILSGKITLKRRLADEMTLAMRPASMDEGAEIKTDLEKVDIPGVYLVGGAVMDLSQMGFIPNTSRFSCELLASVHALRLSFSKELSDVEKILEDLDKDDSAHALRSDPRFMAVVGSVYLDKGEVKKAVATLTKALSQYDSLGIELPPRCGILIRVVQAYSRMHGSGEASDE